MTTETVHSDDPPEGAYVRLPVPLGDTDAFRHGATGDVLHVLVDNPERTFTNRGLHRVTGRGLGGVNAAVDTLEALGVVDVDRSGRANAVRADPEMLVTPDDPVTVVPQSEFHAPIRAVLSRLDARIGEPIGVVLFGSVARGDADRTSDIDLFVVVEDGRMDAQRAAHDIERAMADERIDGERYEPHIVVETRESAPGHDRIDDVLTEGVTLRETPALDAVKREVFDSGTD
ncbi:nucleotidyltransferase domain-containing protein [Halosimplex rubrum]|uniref:Nucleotidyltransferase domain-containing protein n=1 Tax=Halosimplex rubrum TaxID=869889 RepID=A0A7D5SW70_9EURY|nr:nucleotidyltransferase domain-containing protein [Halosimplex rubrum]QLH76371.1 nucleotidyltransferase domain-containing protein [Halosimplex rubrum]